MNVYDYWNEDNYIEHYGTKGQKWGERKYQYQDGTLTPAGKIRYGVGNAVNAYKHGLDLERKGTERAIKKLGWQSYQDLENVRGFAKRFGYNQGKIYDDINKGIKYGTLDDVFWAYQYQQEKKVKNALRDGVRKHDDAIYDLVARQRDTEKDVKKDLSKQIYGGGYRARSNQTAEKHDSSTSYKNTNGPKSILGEAEKFKSILGEAEKYQHKSILGEAENYDNEPSGYAIDNPKLELTDSGASMVGRIQNPDIVGENRERDWYLKQEIDKTGIVKTSIIDASYDDPSKRVDKRTLGTKIVDIYKSGLGSIGNWAAGLFKK